MLMALGAGIIGIFSIIALCSPFAGLMLYWAWFIIRPQEIVLGLGGGLPLERILVIAIVISLFLHKKEPLYMDRAVKGPLVFTATLYLSVITTTIWRGGALVVANEVAKTLVFLFCLVNLVSNYGRLIKFLWVYVLATAVVLGTSLWQFYTHPYFAEGIQRLQSLEATYGDPNATAANIALVIPFLFVLMKGRRFPTKILLLAIFVTGLVCIILTGSRMGAVATVFILLALALSSPKRRIFVPVFCVFMVCGWFAMSPEQHHRYKSLLRIENDVTGNVQDNGTADDSADESAYGRVIGFKVAMQMFYDKPIFGVGAGDFGPAWGDPHTPYNFQGLKFWNQPHNLPGQLLSELGLVGVASFSFLVVGLLKRSREAGQHLRVLQERFPDLEGLSRAIPIIVIALFILGFGGHNLYRYNWFLMAGLSAVLSRATDSIQATNAATGAQEWKELPDDSVIEVLSYRTSGMLANLNTDAAYESPEINYRL
jgi:O-antigen ligase